MELPVQQADAPTKDSAPGISRAERIGVVIAAIVAGGAILFAYHSWSTVSQQLNLGGAETAVSSGEPTAKEQVVEGARQSMATYSNKGKDVRIERYLPIKKGKYPVIIFLHGGGPASLPGANGMRVWCRNFVRRGYVTLLPRYLDSTGTEMADPPAIDRNFVQWMKAIDHAIDYARELPEVDPDRVGLIGWSLGGALALEVAATNPHSTAVVGNIGGMAKEITDKLKRMPPTLLLDGEDDTNYPVQLARELYRTLKKKGVTVESKIYKGQGHGFGGEAAIDAERRTIAWFAKYLAK
jgi:dipeptidyl aminopeptidase/acylaminoacyl peptidase